MTTAVEERATAQATHAAAGTPGNGRRDRRGPRIAAALIALGLLLVAVNFPLWQATLNAPQYPDGLQIVAYGDKVTGDVREINSLNHYIGMKPLEWENITERKLWVPTLLLVLIATAAGITLRKGPVGKAARIGLWLVPVGILADIQFRLYQYGHDLYPGAALRIPEFTPWVVGNTKVWNFSTVALPGLGVIALFLLAAVVTFGPKLFGKIHIVEVAPPAAAALLFLAVAPVPAFAVTGHHAPVDLQALLDAAAPGGMVELEPVTHHGSVTISKPVTIVGNGATLHGDGDGTVLRIASDDVTVSDLTAMHSARGPVGSPAGIAVTGRRIALTNVTVADSYLGIFVRDGRDVTIEGATVHGRAAEAYGDPDHATGDDGHGSYGRSDMSEGRGDGIAVVNSNDVVVRDTTVAGTRDGLYLSWARHVLLDSNSIADGRYGIHSMFSHDLTAAGNEVRRNVAGMVFMYGGRVLAIDNHIARNRSASTGFGLLSKDVTELEAAKNVIEGNRIGIQVEGLAGAGPSSQRFILNTVALNGIGSALLPSASATFTGNSFVENQVQVISLGGRVAANVAWAEKGAGNYWSDYRGFDRDGDGVGEVEYRSAGITSRLLDENPSLYALIGSPAFNMTAAAQQRWMSPDAAILDELPLMEPHSPGVGPGGEGGNPLPLPVAGGVGALLAVLGFAAFRVRPGGRIAIAAEEAV